MEDDIDDSVEITLIKQRLKSLEDERKSFRRDIKANIRELLADNTITKEQADLMLDANKLKAQLRDVLSTLVDEEVRRLFDLKSAELAIRLYKRVSIMADDHMREFLQTYNLKEMIREEIKAYSANLFKPVLETSLELSYNRIRSKISRDFKHIHDLKTSTITEIKESIDAIDTRKEAQVLSSLGSIESGATGLEYREERLKLK